MTSTHQPFEDGFLSASIQEVRADVHKQYPVHVELLYATNRRAMEMQYQLSIRRDNLREALGAALYARTLTTTQSAALLLEHGLPSQGRTILRASLETLFPLAALAKNPNVASAIVASHDADRRTLVDRIRRWKSPELRASIESKLSEAELDEMSKGPGKATNIYELAKMADMEDWYLTLYSLLSFAAHAKVSDLDSHVVTDVNGDPLEFRNEPDILAQDAEWAWVTEVQLAAMRSVATIFSLDCRLIEPLAQRLHELAEFDGK